jgi:hypothetical protein
MNRNSKKNLPCLLSAVLLLGPFSQANAQISSAFNDSANKALVAAEFKNKRDAVEQSSADCADNSNPDTIAGAQKAGIQEDQEVAAKPINLNKFFQIGKDHGCFAALADFPDLSINIPSLADIYSNMTNALINYATRKVCDAVNETIAEVVSPIKSALDQVSERGQLDLNGRVNKEMTTRMYDFDPELGRVSTKAQADKEIEFKW